MFNLVVLLIDLVGSIIFTYTHVHCYKLTFSKPRLLTLNNWLILLICSIIFIVSNTRNNAILIPIFSTLILFSLFYLLFQDTLGLLIYKTLFICLISVISELIASVLLSFFVPDFQVLNKHIILKLAFNIFVAIVLHLVFISKPVSWLYQKALSFFTNFKKSIFILGFIFLVVVYCASLYAMNYKDIEHYLLSITLIIALSLLASFHFKQLYSSKMLELNNKYLEDNLVHYEDIVEQYRTIKHNIINDFLFIKSISPNKNHELISLKMDKYYNDYAIIDKINHVPSGMRGLIYVKSMVAKQRGINFSLNLRASIDYKQMNHRLFIDLCEVISIILDNAIEASVGSKEKLVQMDSAFEEVHVIEIINTFSNNIDLNRLGARDYSTKNRGSGIGLNYIHKLNKNIIIEREIIDNLFKTKIKF